MDEASSSASSQSRIQSILSVCGIPFPNLWAELLYKGRHNLESKADLQLILQSLNHDHSACSKAAEKVQSLIISPYSSLVNID